MLVTSLLVVPAASAGDPVEVDASTDGGDIDVRIKTDILDDSTDTEVGVNDYQEEGSGVYFWHCDGITGCTHTGTEG